MDKVFSNINVRKKIYVVMVILITSIILITFTILNIGPSGENNITTTPTPQPFTNTNKLQPPQIKSPSNISTNDLGDVVFSFENPTLPRTAKIYSSSTRPLLESENEKIASRLSFIESPEIRQSTYGNIQIFRDNGRTLSFYPNIGRVEYINTPSSQSASLTPAISELELKAKGALEDLAPYTSHLELDSSGITYYRLGGDLTQVNTLSDAEILSIPFIYSLAGLTIYGQYGESASADVWINKGGEILKITVRNANSIQNEQTVDLISIEDAKTKVLSGDGIITRLGEQYHAPTTITTISTVNLSGVSLAYLRDSSQEILSPILVFKGLAQTSVGEEEIILYLPAVK